MINKDLTDSILLVGPDCESPRGGIGMVTRSYRQIFSSFNYLTTQREGGKVTKIMTFAKALLRLIPLLAGKKIGIVHVHGSSDGSFVRKAIVILLSKWAGKKIVYHIHSGGFKTFVNRHPRAVKAILHRCDCIVALSDYWKDYFEHEMHCPRVAVVHNIMDRPQEDHSVRLTDVCTFLFLGKICDHKGTFDLLEVVSTHQDTLRGRMRLLIAGNGETDRLEEYIRDHHLTDMVDFRGWVSGDDKRILLNLSDVVVLPSYYEGVPICLLEGFSYHLPAISTPVGGIPEILHDGVNGFLIPPGDKTALYQAMMRMLDHPADRSSMGNQAYTISKDHLPEKVEESLLQIYREI